MYWWQEESKKTKVLQLLMQLAVNLGRLPTFEEAAASDGDLVHEATFYYGSYSNLAEMVASQLYGSSMRTYPTEEVRLNGVWNAKSPDAEMLQANYEVRLVKLGLAPKDAKRLTEPAPRASSAKVKPTEIEVKLPERPKVVVQSAKIDHWSVKRAPEAPEAIFQGVTKQVLGQIVEQTAMLVAQKSASADDSEVTEKEVNDMRGGRKPAFDKAACIEILRRVDQELGGAGKVTRSQYMQYAEAHAGEVPSFAMLYRQLGATADWSEKYLQPGGVDSKSTEMKLDESEEQTNVKNTETEVATSTEILNEEVTENVGLKSEDDAEAEQSELEPEAAGTEVSEAANMRAPELNAAEATEEAKIDSSEEPEAKAMVAAEPQDVDAVTKPEALGNDVIDVTVTGVVKLQLALGDRPTTVVVKLGNN